MKLNQYEQAELEAALSKMNKRQKAEYYFSYYKWQIFLVLIAIFILINTLHRELTKKTDILYLGLANVTVGEDVEKQLTEDYLMLHEINPKRNQVYVYSGWYVSNDSTVENHQYAFASRMKIMAAIEAMQLDVVIMNQEAYDIFSEREYLLPLDDIGPGFEALLTDNTVILEDNTIEYDLNEADELRIVTEEVTNGLNVTECPLFKNAEFDGSIYLGIVANTPRLEESIEYLRYLIQ